MLYGLAADAVVILHFLFILFVILGGFIVLKNRRWMFLHLPAAAWGVIVECQGRICPLTPLEQWLREQAGQATYGTGFIGHYLVPLVYPPGLTQGMQVLLGSAVVLINAAIYFRVYRTMKQTETDP